MLHFICLTRSIWKMLGPFATTSRLTPIHQVSPLYCRTPPAHRCPRRQRHDDNDNTWQRGPRWPHGMGPIRRECKQATTVLLLVNMSPGRSENVWKRDFGHFWMSTRGWGRVTMCDLLLVSMVTLGLGVLTTSKVSRTIDNNDDNVPAYLQSCIRYTTRQRNCEF